MIVFLKWLALAKGHAMCDDVVREVVAVSLLTITGRSRINLTKISRHVRVAEKKKDNEGKEWCPASATPTPGKPGKVDIYAGLRADDEAKRKSAFSPAVYVSVNWRRNEISSS
jgi:hypothetical protein